MESNSNDSLSQEEDISVVSNLKLDDENPTPTTVLNDDDGKMKYLNSIDNIFKAVRQSNITILDSYLARPVSIANEVELVVVYESETNISPIPINLIKWKQVSRNGERRESQENKNWTLFRDQQKNDFIQCLQDFTDPICCDIIRNCSDVIAVMPSAYNVFDKAPFEPALLVLKKCAGYNCLGSLFSNYVIEGRITLSNGRNLRVIEEDGWFDPTYSIGSGIGFENSTMNEFGSLGAFAEGNGTTYATTCEHVVTELWKIELKKAPVLRKKTMDFHLPSQGPRKFQLLSAVGAVNHKLPLNNNFLQCLLTQYDNPKMKQFLSIYRDITIKDIAEYLTRDQLSLRVKFEDILMYSSTSVRSTFGPDQVDLVGDLAAIPLPAGTVLSDQCFQINNKPFKVLTGDDVYQQLMFQHLEVKKTGAKDPQTPILGFIQKPGHLKIRIPLNRESNLLDPSGGSIVLYNQYIVYSNQDFGHPGDSGGLVYHETDDNIFLVGTFVGNLNSSGSLSAVSPADVIAAHSLQWKLSP